jgi:RNA polymerase sigma-70 factor (ECF subfamily)
VEIKQTDPFSRNRAGAAPSNREKDAMASRDAQMDDLRCVADTRKGRTEAFGEIVRRHQDRLFNTIYRLMGDYQEAKDLTQQAFLKAYMSLERFRGSSSFYTWLYRIGVNVALDARKKRARSPDLIGDSLAAGADDDGRGGPSSAADDPAESALSREREAAVTKAIASLDELHRGVLVLRDIEGMDYDEIADVLSCPRGTVKSRLHRARLVLREKLKDLMQ